MKIVVPQDKWRPLFRATVAPVADNGSTSRDTDAMNEPIMMANDGPMILIKRQLTIRGRWRKGKRQFAVKSALGIGQPEEEKSKCA
jgi:hypothetical protein